jgi:hypothetical protein
MKNIFHRNINPPVEFVDVDYPITNEVMGFRNNKIPRDMVNPEFHRWIESLGLYIDDTWGRFFPSTPYQQYGIHADSKMSFLPRTKINIIFDSYGTEMIWYRYEPRPGHRTIIHTEYQQVFSQLLPLNKNTIRIYDPEDCVEVFRTNTDQHCILDASKIHTLINSDNRGKMRRSFSLTLARLSDKQLVTFEETLERMKDFIV